ncbi:MAG: lipoprotein-releasing system ATP-binding protein [Rhodospirillaceae bacterium]|jgi:ABC-type lipoprotein export system ATPase subunit|nr:lipoprotein-releasing system ATP-binding protein [Rhodospirillaceae bacterium]
MSSPLVEAVDVSRVYQQGNTLFRALDSASCRVFPGDRIALVGPSGSGKSTLLHLLGGLDEPTSGTIIWPDLGPVETLRPEMIAFVFQGQSLLPSLNVVENVELPVLLGPRAGNGRAAANAALERLGLSSLSEKLPEELSGGQAQRAAVARAIAGQPRLILADEPTGQLDGATASALFDALLIHLAGTDAALVVATHDLAVAAKLGRLWKIEHGVLETAPCSGSLS